MAARRRRSDETHAATLPKLIRPQEFDTFLLLHRGRPFAIRSEKGHTVPPVFHRRRKAYTTTAYTSVNFTEPPPNASKHIL